jgi:hypothetical protein
MEYGWGIKGQSSYCRYIPPLRGSSTKLSLGSNAAMSTALIPSNNAVEGIFISPLVTDVGAKIKL